MIKTASICINNRHRYIDRIIENIKANPEHNEYKYIVGIEPNFYQNMEVDFSFLDSVEVIKNKKQLGCIRNQYQLLEKAFEEYNSDFHFYIEEDCSLSPDAYLLADWYRLHLDDEDKCISGSFYNQSRGLESDFNPFEINRRQNYYCWNVCFSKRQWNQYVKPNWFNGVNGMWRHSHGPPYTGHECMAEMTRKDKTLFQYIPNLSRAEHIGILGGIHYNHANPNHREIHQDVVSASIRYNGEFYLSDVHSTI